MATYPKMKLVIFFCKVVKYDTSHSRQLIGPGFFKCVTCFHFGLTIQHSAQIVTIFSIFPLLNFLLMSCLNHFQKLENLWESNIRPARIALFEVCYNLMSAALFPMNHQKRCTRRVSLGFILQNEALYY